MGAAMAQARAEGIFHVAFGDLFLEDIRRYREEKLRAVGMTPVFPLWGRDTHLLAREMVAGGLRAYLTCVDPRQLDRRFAGRAFDASLLDELPAARGPLRREGRIPLVRFCGTDVCGPARGRAWRNRRTRRLRLRRPAAGGQFLKEARRAICALAVVAG